MNNALFTPYMIYMASGHYFVQPFFTNTQNLGAGHTAMVVLEGSLNEQSYFGAHYSFMNLAEFESMKSLNQSECIFMGFAILKVLKKDGAFRTFGVISLYLEVMTFLYKIA